MISIKHLLPSLREKKRYLTYSVLSQQSLSFAHVVSALQERLRTFLGEMGYGAAHLHFLPHPEKRHGIIRVNHSHVDFVRAGMITLTAIDHQPVILQTVTVSGMIHKAQSLS